MFIGYYELEGKEYFNIYYKCWEGYDLWFKDTFPPVKNVKTLDFEIKGWDYESRKAYLEDLAKEWQLEYASLGWSYSELAEICNWFYENGKRYGLLREFRENAIC